MMRPESDARTGFDPPLGQDQPALAFLSDILASVGSNPGHPTRALHDRLQEMVDAWHPAGEQPADLFGRHCSTSPPAWHLRKLLESIDEASPSSSEIGRARLVFHAHWLAHLLMPDRPEFRPSVTILIPVYNRAAMAAEAVESCLAQSWRPIEILVIDDGSTDDLAGALARFGDAVRLVRQANGGVSSARNAGIRLATGDFVHFLDSDNLLLPEAVARKVDAFARFPDAELCYSLAELRGERLVAIPRIAPPDGSPGCPTVSMLGRGLSHAFNVSCVMMPRFALLAAGGFEEDLRRGEDTRFWVKLALRDTKVVGLASALTIRRVSQDTLSATQMPPQLELLIAARTIADCLAQPRAWPLAARRMPGLLEIILGQGSPLPPGVSERDISSLLAALGALVDGRHRDGKSPLPLLAQFRHLSGHALLAERRMSREKVAMLRRLHGAIDAAAGRAAPLTRSDIAFWVDAAAARPKRTRLNGFIASIAAKLGSNPAMLPLADELLRGMPFVPTKRAIRRYLKLRRWMPRPIALWAVRRKAR